MRTCTIDHCDKPHRAKGLCVSHYNQQLPNRYVIAEYTCRICRKVVLKEKGREKRYGHTYCSAKCMGRGFALVSSQVALYKPTAAAHRFIQRAPRNAPQRSPRVFATGACRICGANFTDLYGSATCSDTCQASWHLELKREGKHRRRARERGAYVAPVNRKATYERDNWTCMLCLNPVDRTAVVPASLAPTLDHIIALANGGTHEPSNVQTAHFLCNALKSDKDWTPVLMSA